MIRFLKTLHGWLGFFVMPWIVVIGLTGIYLNHGRSIYPLLPLTGAYDESGFDSSPLAAPQDRASARALAVAVMPDTELRLRSKDVYHDRPVFRFQAPDRSEVIVDRATGHYWVKTWFQRRTYDPGGTLLHRKIYWGALFGRLHRAGWIDRSLGTWLADITGGAMALFGLSGIVLFLTPRIRRWKNRLARRRTQGSGGAGPGGGGTGAGGGRTAGAAPGKVPRPRRIRLDDL